MSPENREALFESDEDVVFTLTDEDGVDTDMTPIACFEVEELEAEYLVMMPVNVADDDEEVEVTCLRYSEDEFGEMEIDVIEDPEELELVSQLLGQLIESGQLGDVTMMKDDEDDEEEKEEDLASSISRMFPGISFDKE